MRCTKTDILNELGKEEKERWRRGGGAGWLGGGEDVAFFTQKLAFVSKGLSEADGTQDVSVVGSNHLTKQRGEA